MIDQEYSSLRRVAADSRLGRAAAAAADLVARAWRDSLASRGLQQGRREVLSWPVHERVRVAMLVAGFGALGHRTLLYLVPPYVAPGVPPDVFLGLGVLALSMATAAPRLTEAWPHSAIARLTSWLVR